ncbi:hypothetical protein ACFV1W_25475 [Kitasatospora sp. NPDC059648]|uniref:hypothetical protein n=1 Tax=Kitasatospora sp. NPDC059648 TaxID=3346894 RepID=UPI0036A76DC6
MDERHYVRALLGRLQDAGEGWLTPPSGGLVLAEVVPLMRRAEAATTGAASRLWGTAATMSAAKLWVVAEVDSDGELWDRVLDLVRQASACQPAD